MIHKWVRWLSSGVAKSVVTVVLLVMLAACAAQAPVPQDKYYRLQAIPAFQPLSSPVLSGVLEIERFTADGLTAGRPIVYVDAADPNQLREYHYHFWTQAPTIMLRDELVTYLRQAGVATNVVTPEMRLEADYALGGRIRLLEQVIGSKKGTAMELEISLRNPRDGQLLFLKSYRHDVEQSTVGVAAVDSLNEALNIIYADILADLKNL
jgi:ABC-type uncharacterized transport system auxiliary subunit